MSDFLRRVRSARLRHGARAREVLIATQVGLCALLLFATGLFLKSFMRVHRVDKGASRSSARSR